ncbi:MAG: hypothetical protein ACI8TQ_001569 [Planctomycetota bacterium]|jgi:hypothetical protein
MRRRRQKEEKPVPTFYEKIRDFGNPRSWWRYITDGLEDGLIQFAQQNASILAIAAYTVAKATGITVKSGNTGLLFSFGRAKQEIAPGFRFLIPFLQIVKTVPTRQRTLDLPAQRVTTFDGLVYLVDANLVYQITDIRKALIEIDDLAKGMRQVLVLSVQEVLRNSGRESIQVAKDIDGRLESAMAVRLKPWGVDLIHAGFTSITPSPTTLKLVQLGARVESRRKGIDLLESVTGRPLALALIGTPHRFITRAGLLREREIDRRRHRRMRRTLRTEIKRSGLKLSPKERSRLVHKTSTYAGFKGVLGDTRSRTAPTTKSS